MTVQVRQRTLRNLILLIDFANKKKGADLSVDIVMKVLNISRRTAYDYLIAFQYIRASAASQIKKGK